MNSATDEQILILAVQSKLEYKHDDLCFTFYIKYLFYAYQYLLLGLYPDEQVLILTSPAQVHVGESVYSLAKIKMKKNYLFFLAVRAPLTD